MVAEVVKVISGSAPSALLGAWLYVNTATLDFALTPQPQLDDCICRDPAAARLTFQARRRPSASVA